uniref:Putative secreted protein n=1 Tax=Anopheles triannulatus TaxID=58253 RepID=A0A2M4B6L2_9DIPT
MSATGNGFASRTSLCCCCSGCLCACMTPDRFFGDARSAFWVSTAAADGPLEQQQQATRRPGRLLLSSDILTISVPSSSATGWGTNCQIKCRVPGLVVSCSTLPRCTTLRTLVLGGSYPLPLVPSWFRLRNS